MKTFSLKLVLLISLTLIAIPIASYSGTAPVSGSFLGNGKEAHLAFAVATKGKPFSGKATTVIILSEKDPGTEERPDLRASFGKLGSALVITVLTESGEVIGCEVTHAAHSKKSFSTSGSLKLTEFKQDSTSVEGKITTDGEKKFFEDTWKVDLTFKAKRI